MVTKLDNITSIPDFNIPRLNVIKSENDITHLIDTYIREQRSKINNREFLDLDILDFLHLLKKVIETRQKSEGIKEDNYIFFLEDDPQEKINSKDKEEINTEAIAWQLNYRRPGQWSKGRPEQGGAVRELRPHLRKYEDHSTVPGEKLLTYGKTHDSKFTFWCYARTDKVALRRALWLTQVMDSFNWFFHLYGFRVIEDEISEKENITIQKLDLVKYPVSYIVRCDDTYQVSSQEFRELLLNLNVSK